MSNLVRELILHACAYGADHHVSALLTRQLRALPALALELPMPSDAERAASPNGSQVIRAPEPD